MDNKCSDIRGKVKQDDEFKRWTCTSQETDVVDESPGEDLDNQSLEVGEKFYYLGDTIVASYFEDLCHIGVRLDQLKKKT